MEQKQALPKITITLDSPVVPDKPTVNERVYTKELLDGILAQYKDKEIDVRLDFHDTNEPLTKVIGRARNLRYNDTNHVCADIDVGPTLVRSVLDIQTAIEVVKLLEVCPEKFGLGICRDTLLIKPAHYY